MSRVAKCPRCGQVVPCSSTGRPLMHTRVEREQIDMNLPNSTMPVFRETAVVCESYRKGTRP